MPMFLAESSSTKAENMNTSIKLNTKQPRIQINQQPPPIIESDPINDKAQSKIHSFIQSTKCSSFLLSTFSNEPTTNNPKKKVYNFTQTTFRGRLGCTAAKSQQVCVPTVIRTSADWDEKRKILKKKKQHLKKHSGGAGPGDDVAIPDDWCDPRIGFSENSIGSVVVDDCVPERGKIDGDKICKREKEPRSKFPTRRTVNPESLSFWDSDPLPVGPNRDIFGGRYDRHARHPSPDSFAEILMFRNTLRMVGHDRFRDWRLDVDGMTYEQLLELGDRIGYVSTGLKDEEINRCILKIKPLNLNDAPSKLHVHVDKKCTICQFEYEEGEENGKLDCGHSFHISCIKQWLGQKNSCPVCKTTALARR